jgi:hypothetical protein
MGRDLILVRTEGTGPPLQRIHFTHPAYMPLHYMLLLPNGDSGRHFGLQLQTNANPAGKRLKMTAQMYYRYLLYQRPTERDPSVIHNSYRHQFRLTNELIR